MPNELDRRTRRLVDPQSRMNTLFLVLIIVLLAVNAYTLVLLARARSIARTEVVALSEQLNTLRNDTISFTLPVRQEVPISAQVPVNQQLTVPISTSIFIDTSVQVPINTPLGNTSISVPVRGNFPVRVDVPVTIDTNLEVKTSVDLDLQLPINIPMSDTPFAGLLADLETRLRNLSEEL